MKYYIFVVLVQFLVMARTEPGDPCYSVILEDLQEEEKMKHLESFLDCEFPFFINCGYTIYRSVLIVRVMITIPVTNTYIGTYLAGHAWLTSPVWHRTRASYLLLPLCLARMALRPYKCDLALPWTYLQIVE